jgi:hypothetical protein
MLGDPVLALAVRLLVLLVVLVLLAAIVRNTAAADPGGGGPVWQHLAQQRPHGEGATRCHRWNRSGTCS